MQRDRIHLVLRHDHVLGRDEQLIHASVTQIDLHDFARLSLTYGLGGFHCVTEMEAQLGICQEMLRHWMVGYGRDYNPDRHQALRRLSLQPSFDALVATLTTQYGAPPLVVATSASPGPPEKQLDFSSFSRIMAGSGCPILVQFGTSWGLSQAQLNRCDWILSPIEGHAGYNHLSVRCAAAIIVDRICRTGTSQT